MLVNEIKLIDCPPPKDKDALCRIESVRYSCIIDIEAEKFGVSPPQLMVHWFVITKRTERGAWILDWCNKKKFVLLTAHKKFACETLEDALESFKKRKERQVAILNAQLERAKADLNLVTKTKTAVF